MGLGQGFRASAHLADELRDHEEGLNLDGEDCQRERQSPSNCRVEPPLDDLHIPLPSQVVPADWRKVIHQCVRHVYPQNLL